MANRVEIARYLAETFVSDDLRIDDDAAVSPIIGKGVWVQAWVFISQADIDAAFNDQSTLPIEMRD